LCTRELLGCFPLLLGGEFSGKVSGEVGGEVSREVSGRPGVEECRW